MPETEKFDERDSLRPIDQKRRDEIAAGLKRNFHIELTVSVSEWDLLEILLHKFSRTCVDWRGYLNKGEVVKIEGIASKASKLSLAIDQATQLGLGKILDYDLAPMTSGQLLASLDVLARMDPRSPKDEDGKKNVGMRYQDGLKADLQLDLDNWWLRSTGFPAETKKEELTPFSYFLAQIFKILPSEVANDLGSSRSAIDERRRNAARQQARKQEISRAFKKLHSTKCITDA
ncbi:hypothetical protein FTO60_10525 [Octadecabacter sp. SW4]|uniref:hypothetical protein n=1 Tax=Octadecabacter sp. SW4 TaxID=2602067 RepID=UPI0011C1D412|nr:hypothetical protein [Octadecabacter sp. SW4]QEE36106.1 hypothetical protein FTO60_10525 [Octadecabacter sp. SW4]